MEELVKLLKEISSQMAQLKEETKCKEMSRRDRLSEELFQLKLQLVIMRENRKEFTTDYEVIKAKIVVYEEEIKNCK